MIKKEKERRKIQETPKGNCVVLEWRWRFRWQKGLKHLLDSMLVKRFVNLLPIKKGSRKFKGKMTISVLYLLLVNQIQFDIGIIPSNCSEIQVWNSRGSLK